jgi:hypothetical protein
MAQSMWLRHPTWWSLWARQAGDTSLPIESGWGLRHCLRAFVVRPGASRQLRFLVLKVRSSWWFCRLSRKRRAAACQAATFTFRAGRLWDLVPGEIAGVKPAKQWTYAGNPCLSGAIESTRLDAKALGLVPLGLKDVGVWNPAEHYWGEDGDPIEDWAKPVIARGPRPEFEMDQVLPGLDVEDSSSDPVGQSNDCKDAGDFDGAHKILMDLCQADLRCLDAHSHLGNFVFDHRPKDAIRHYEVGFRIGELSLGDGFDGVLPWGWIDNRPFLRCMHGFGLCLWRLGRFEEAAGIFDRMLWLNPSDNQGVRFIIDEVRAGAPWREE